MKKLLSLAVAFLIFISLSDINVFAESKVIFKASTAEGNRGDVVEINVDISNVSAPGLTGFDVIIEFDNNNLEAVSISKNSSAFKGNLFIAGNPASANITGRWTTPCAGVSPVVYNGTLVTAKFKVKDSASFGEYVLKLKCNAYDENGKKISTGITQINGKIAVACDNHVSGEWKIEKPAGCENNGTEVKRCKNCSAVMESRSIASLGHNWGDWVKSEGSVCGKAGKETRVCERDASHIETRAVDAIDHEWNGWLITTEPTLDSFGEATRTCKYDNSHKETTKLPKTVLVLTDESSKITIEISDKTNDSWFYGDSQLTALEWEDTYEYLRSLGVRNDEITELKAKLSEIEEEIKTKSSSNVLNRYYISVENANFDLCAGNTEDASVFLTIPVIDKFEKIENFKLYFVNTNENKQEPFEGEFEITDKGIVINVTDVFSDLNGNFSVILTGDIPSDGNRVIIAVVIVAIIIAASLAAFVLLRRKNRSKN